MKLAEALEKVNQTYIPGCIEYYAKLNPDPWQDLHEIWTQKIVANEADWELQEKLHDVYAGKIIALIEDYRRQKDGVWPEAKPHEAFFMGEDGHAKEMSVKRKVCFRCDVKTGLKIKTDETTKRPYLACKDHAGGAR